MSGRWSGSVLHKCSPYVQMTQPFVIHMYLQERKMCFQNSREVIGSCSIWPCGQALVYSHTAGETWMAPIVTAQARWGSQADIYFPHQLLKSPSMKFFFASARLKTIIFLLIRDKYAEVIYTIWRHKDPFSLWDRAMSSTSSSQFGIFLTLTLALPSVWYFGAQRRWQGRTNMSEFHSNEAVNT